jgi:maltose-binding protein MalE
MASRLFTTPTLRKVIESPAFRDNPVLQLALEQAKHSIPMPVDNRIRFIWDAFREPYRRVFADDLPPDEAARLMQREAERRIAESQP